MQWLYQKLYHGPSKQRADYLILHYVRPMAHTLLADGLIATFFYILYAEGGSHIRFRLLGEQAALDDVVRPRLEAAIERSFEHIRTLPIEPYPQQSIAGFNLKPYPSYEYDVYEPEYEKYGGEQGVRVAEAHFQDSSEAAFRVLEAEQQQLVKRQQAALLLIEALMDHFSAVVPQRSEFYARCRDYWIAMMPQDQQGDWYTYFDQRYHAAQQTLVRQMSAQADRSGPLDEILAFFRTRTFVTTQDLQNLAREQRLTAPIGIILQNYVHMLCNRLGITTVEEAFLLHLLHRWKQTESDPI